PDFDDQESTVYTYGGTIDGTIELNANYQLAKTDKIINLDAEMMTLSSTSKLIIKTYGIGKIDYVLIDGYEEGRFGSIDIPSSSNYRIVYEKDRIRFVSSARTYFSAQPNTDNQQIMAQMLDDVSWFYDGMPPEIHKLISSINQLDPSQWQEIFQQMSGTVYANVIKSLAKDKNFNYLFRQMSLYQWDKRPAAWVNVYHSDRKYKHNLDFADDFNVFGQGAIAGYDFFQIENSLITGGYLGYGDYFLKEGDYADGRIWDFEAGLYAMKALKIFEENFNVMANFAAGRQNLEIKREISVNDLSYSPHSSFYTNTLKVAFKSEYVRKVADNIRIKPFLGFEEGFVSYDNIRETDSKETELSIDEGNYLRSAVFAGVGADGEFWGFVTDLEIYGGVLISGQKARFKGKLLNSIEKIKSQEIKGAKENVYGGVSAGVSYLILDNLSVGLSVNIETGERADTFWQYYGLNAKYKFGKRQYPDVDYDYLKARQAYDKGRYIEASEILNELVAASTQSEAGAALLSEIKDMISQDADRKSEMDYQNHAYAKAYNAYFEGEYARAIFEWKKYIEFAGEGQDVEEYLDKVTKILEMQREESLTQNVEAMLNEGIARYQEKRWYDCIKKMDELQKYVMENKFSKSESYFGKAKKYIDESLKELSKGIEIPKSADLKPAVDEQPIAANIDEEAAQEKYNEGFELYAQGKYQEAQRAWEQVLRINPNHAKAKIALLRMKEEGQLQNSD
ncbi:MAG: autotransporter domain-containing protein, partial [Elusimicrobiota bacterium]|nr:autotransporter domain-containing protein [Elusimicrobiota bacterium]